MKLTLIRTGIFPKHTIGVLYVDGERQCYSLEDEDRKLEEGGVKILKQTAIPRGTYRVVLDMSTRFKKIMPHILDVPQFTGIRIHAGNTAEDVEGCILVGRRVTAGECSIYESLVARNALMEKLTAAVDRDEEITIEIS